MSRPIEIPRRDDDERSAGASEIIKGIFRRIRASGKTYDEVVREAGLDKKTLTSWRGDDVFPQLDSVTRCLRVLGFSLVIVRQEGCGSDMATSPPRKQPGRMIEPPRGEDDEWSAGANDILDMLVYYIGESPLTRGEVASEAGLDEDTVKSWRDESVFPQLDSVLRCFRVLGYSLVIKRSEDSAFAHPGYFAMRDRREEVRCKKAGLPLTTVFGTPEWEEANSFAEWPEPTPEEIAADNARVPSPGERHTLAEASAKRRDEERRKLFDEIRPKRKSETTRKRVTAPVREPRKARPSHKAMAHAKMTRTVEGIARKSKSPLEISAV
jgi:DNA-binding phage protein